MPGDDLLVSILYSLKKLTILKNVEKTKQTEYGEVAKALSQPDEEKQFHEWKTLVKDKYELPSQGCRDECVHTNGEVFLRKENQSQLF